MKKYLIKLLAIVFLFTGINTSNSQTGPEHSGQDSIRLFVGSGLNQLLVGDLEAFSLQSLTITATSSNTNMLEIINVEYLQGQTFAILHLQEKGVAGIVPMEVIFNDGSASDSRSFNIHIGEYDNQGANFQIFDIVFWQEQIPLTASSVFDTVIHTTQGPYNHINYDNIPLTVNLDCNGPNCTGHDFFTAMYRGYIVPEVSGTYTFYMTSVDRFGFWLSNNANFTNAQKLIFRGTSQADEGTAVEGMPNTVRSQDVELVAGQTYAYYATQWVVHTTMGGILYEGPGIDMQYIPLHDLRFILDTIKPTVPENLSLEWKASDRMQVSWDAATDNISLAGYNLYVNGFRFNDDLIGETHFRLENLEPETLYNLVVTSADRLSNESFVSNTLEVETFTVDENPPSPPTQLEVLQATGLALKVEWSGATDAETDVVAYNLYVDGELYNTSDFIFSNNQVIYNLRPNIEYAITLEALDAGFNVSSPSSPFLVSTVDFDPLGESLGEKRGRVVVHNQNISWTGGLGLNVPYENGNYPNNPIITDLVEEFGSGAVRWGAITANSRSFAGSTGPSPSHNNTYARVMNHANGIGAYFALTVGVNNDVDYMTEPETFLRLMEYLNGPATSIGGAIRAVEGFPDPLLPGSPGVILEFGNEVWGANAHQAPIGQNYENYAQWVRDMVDLIKTSPYYDPEKIFMTYSGRYPHPDNDFNTNIRVLTGDTGQGDALAVSGYLGGNLNYDPEVPAGASELDYYKNGINMALKNIIGLELTMHDMIRLANTIMPFYLYESNMTTPAYNGRFGQAITMVDYLVAGKRFGSIVPTIFHLTSGQWRIVRPAENYRKLPLYELGKFYNRFGKGHYLDVEFVTNDIITTSGENVIPWSPVGSYGFNLGEDFSIILINRDFENEYTVQIELPADINLSQQARVYTLWEDDFNSFDTNIDSLDVTLASGMFVTVPKHAMVIIAAQGDDPQYVQLPLGHFERVRADSIYAFTNGNKLIDTNRGIEFVYGEVFPENAFSRRAAFEIVENTANAEILFVPLVPTVRVRGSGVCGESGHVSVRVFSAENPEVADTITIFITNQGVDCDGTGIAGIEVEINAMFYPNPARDKLYFDASLPEGSQIAIYDLWGRSLKTIYLEDGYTIPLSDLENGMFILRILKPDGSVLHGKFQKQ